jgi:hypothetical protein
MFTYTIIAYTNGRGLPTLVRDYKTRKAARLAARLAALIYTNVQINTNVDGENWDIYTIR